MSTSKFQSALIVSICAALAAACGSNGTPTTADSGPSNDAGVVDAGVHDAGPAGDGGSAPGAPVLSFTTVAGGVQLAWTLPGAFGDETFSVLRSDDGSPFNGVTGATSLSADAYTDGTSSALPGSAHSYEVTASNGNGTGPASNVVEVQKAPGDVIAGGSDTRVLLVWGPIQTATLYDIYRVPSADGGGGAANLVGSTDGGEYIDSQGITAGANYNYQILAHPIDGGQLSTGSNIASTPAVGIDVSRKETSISDVFDGGVVSSADARATPLTAVYIQADGGLDLFSAITTSTATVISGVPSGSPYYLTYNSDPQEADSFVYLTVTSARAIDADFTQGGRLNATPPQNLTSETTLSYLLNGLNAWSSSDTLQSVSMGAGNQLDGIEFDLNGFDGDAGIKPGQTTFTGKENIDGLLGDPYLVDSSQGDIYYLYQLHNSTSGTGKPYQTITKAFTSASVMMVDGQSTPIAGPMVAQVPTVIPDLMVRNSAFAAQAAAVNPTAVPAGETVLIQTIKDYTTYGNYVGPTPTMLSASVADAGTADVDLGAVGWGNPFPSDWQPFVYVTYSFNVPFDLTGDATGAVFTSTSQFYRPVAGLDWMTDISPQLGPVTNVKINSTLDAFTDQTSVTTSPTISWSAPATGATPTSYTVSLYQLGLDDSKNVEIDGATSAPSQLVTFITTATSVTIPKIFITAETSTAATWYFATVDAQLAKLGTATVDPTVTLSTNGAGEVGTVYSDTQVVTNKFTPGPGRSAPAVQRTSPRRNGLAGAR